jgi:hypothetical protein
MQPSKFDTVGFRLLNIQIRATTRTWLRAVELGAADELLAIVGSWGDTMDDARTLDHLRAFNRNGAMFSEVSAGRINLRRARS